MTIRPRAIALGLALARLACAETDKVMVDVPASSRRCLGEEYPEDSLGRWTFEAMGTVKHGDVKAKPEAADKLRASLKDPARKLIWSEHLGGGKEKMFSFTAKSPGLYRACVENHHAKPQRVALTIEQGWGARDYAKVGAGVFGPVEKQLDDSEHMLKDIAAEMDAALLREERLRDNSESGRDRVEFFGAVSMGVLLLTALWQIFYLRRFFRSKKLL